MAPPEHNALAAIVAVAEQQRRLLFEASIRPDADVAGVARSGLDLLLRTIAAQSSTLAGVPGLTEFAEQLANDLHDAVDVRHHLIELGEGWMCRSCKNDVVAGVVITGLAKDAVRLELACKACGRTTPIGKAGRAAFDERFGDRVGPDWDPRRNGFTWDGR